MPMSPPRHIQEVQASKLGDAQGTPSSSTKISGFFQNTIFLLLHMICVVLGASFLFSFQFCFVFLAVIIGWILSLQFGERHAPFSLPRTLQFSLLFICEYSVFASTAFSSCFSLEFCSELVGLLQLYMISSLVFIEYLLWELFQISLLVLGKSKIFHAYSGAKGSLFRL